MGIERFFITLILIVLSGLTLVLVLMFKGKRRLAAKLGVVTLALSSIWYILPTVDSIASVLFFPHDTAYAPGYTESLFEKVSIGQDRQDVLAMLGEPIERRSFIRPNREYWYYSRHGLQYKSYWNKIVIFDRDTGRIVEKIDNFYSD